jgi:hypothetical protein
MQREKSKIKKLLKFSKFIFFPFFVFVLFFAFCGNAFASGASFYLSPNNGTFFVGSTFDVSVFVNTNGNDINAVRVNLKFDPKMLQIAGPTTGRSFISVWVAQPSYSNIAGTASFQGGVPAPGINTSAGLVSTITFRAIAPGETSIYFSDSSKILLNDGQGTNILDSMGRGVYDLKIPPPEGPIVYSPTHPDQNKWYKNNNPSFSWEKSEGITDFSYSIDNDFAGNPDNISEGDQTSISYSDLSDGIWYFHIKARKGNSWGGITTYAVQIDSTPPAKFTVDFEPKLKSPVTTSREPIVSFITTDALSGIDHYELKVVDFNSANAGNAGFFTEISSPYKIPSLSTGENQIIVRAFDKAGNWQDSTQKFEVIPSEKIFYTTRNGLNIWMIFFPWWVIILLIILLILIILGVVLLVVVQQKKLEEQKKNLKELREKTQKKIWTDPNI